MLEMIKIPIMLNKEVSLEDRDKINLRMISQLDQRCVCVCMFFVFVFIGGRLAGGCFFAEIIGNEELTVCRNK